MVLQTPLCISFTMTYSRAALVLLSVQFSFPKIPGSHPLQSVTATFCFSAPGVYRKHTRVLRTRWLSHRYNNGQGLATAF